MIAGVIIVLLLLHFTFICENKPALASDQKLAHGAGTLPHLTSAITLSLGIQVPIPILYSLQYDIGLGNRVQLGISTWGFPFSGYSVEIHSMFNVLKTARDSDFLSLYLKPSFTHLSISTDWEVSTHAMIMLGPSWTNYRFLRLNSGVAYEHRFGSRRHIGLYTKVGIIGTIEYEEVFEYGEYGDLYFRESSRYYVFDCRVGFQAFFGKRFSIALEPELIFDFDPYLWFDPLGKVALTWAF